LICLALAPVPVPPLATLRRSVGRSPAVARVQPFPGEVVVLSTQEGHRGAVLPDRIARGELCRMDSAVGSAWKPEFQTGR